MKKRECCGTEITDNDRTDACPKCGRMRCVHCDAGPWTVCLKCEEEERGDGMKRYQMDTDIKCPECMTNLGRKVACPACGMVANLQILDERSCGNCRHEALLNISTEETFRRIDAREPNPCACCMRNQPYADNWTQIDEQPGAGEKDGIMKTCPTCKRRFTPEPGAELIPQCPDCWNIGLAIPPKMTDGEVDEARAEIEREGRAVT